MVSTKLRRRDFEQGRATFASAHCIDCHRFTNAGGAVGPDLTHVADRLSLRELLESILEPDKVISERYVSAHQHDVGKTTALRFSFMPSGLANALSEDQLLDLVAYLMSRGDPHDAVFRE